MIEPVRFNDAIVNYLEAGGNIKQINGHHSGVYLSYDDESGYKIVALNILQRFLRATFGCYSNTHLKRVMVHLSEEDCRTGSPQARVISNIANVWLKTYPADRPQVNLREVSNKHFQSHFDLIMEQAAQVISANQNMHVSGLFREGMTDKTFQDLLYLVHIGALEAPEEPNAEDALNYSLLVKKMVEEYCYRAGLELVINGTIHLGIPKGKSFASPADKELLISSFVKIHKVIDQYVQIRTEDTQNEDVKFKGYKSLDLGFPYWSLAFDRETETLK